MNASDPRRFTAFVWCVREKKRRNLVQRELIQRPTDLNERRRDIKKIDDFVRDNELESLIALGVIFSFRLILFFTRVCLGAFYFIFH